MAAQLMKKYGFRTGSVLNKKRGYLLAYDPKLDKKDDFCTFPFTWDGKSFLGGKRNFFATSSCIVDVPESSLMLLSSNGKYGLVSPNLQHTGLIFDESQPASKASRFGDFRSVSAINGHAFAVGHGGMVYRFDDIEKWERIDSGLPETFDIESIDGFDIDELYVAGKGGELWQFSKNVWVPNDTPTNTYLTCVKTTPNERVYIGGYSGVIIFGASNSWKVFEQDAIEEDIWDMEWFMDVLYISTLTNVYQLRDDNLKAVEFGNNKPRTCYHLSSRDGILWSIGEKDVMSFDGKSWQRIA